MYKKRCKLRTLIVSLLLLCVSLPLGLVACVGDPSGTQQGEQTDSPVEEVGGSWNENWD